MPEATKGTQEDDGRALYIAQGHYMQSMNESRMDDPRTPDQASSDTFYEACIRPFDSRWAVPLGLEGVLQQAFGVSERGDML